MSADDKRVGGGDGDGGGGVGCWCGWGNEKGPKSREKQLYPRL